MHGLPTGKGPEKVDAARRKEDGYIQEGDDKIHVLKGQGYFFLSSLLTVIAEEDGGASFNFSNCLQAARERLAPDGVRPENIYLNHLDNLLFYETELFLKLVTLIIMKRRRQNRTTITGGSDLDLNINLAHRQKIVNVQTAGGRIG